MPQFLFIKLLSLQNENKAKIGSFNVPWLP